MKKRSKMQDEKKATLRKGPVKATRKAPGGHKSLIGNAGGVRKKPVRPRGGGLSKASQAMEKNDIPV